jgi:hypothetical protein
MSARVRIARLDRLRECGQDHAWQFKSALRIPPP